jgi:hypothetical protein
MTCSLDEQQLALGLCQRAESDVTASVDAPVTMPVDTATGIQDTPEVGEHNL